MEFYPKPGKARAVQIDVSPTQDRAALSGGSRTRRRLPHGSARAAAAHPKEERSRFIETCQKRMESWNELIDGTRAQHGHADEAAGRDLSSEQAA